MNLSFLTTGAAAGGQGSPVTMILLMVGIIYLRITMQGEED